MASRSFLENLRNLPEDVLKMVRREKVASPVEQRVFSERLPTFSSKQETVASPEHPDRNEDASFIDTERGLMALSDGAGGQNAGEVASRAAMTGVREAMATLDKMLARERQRIGSSYVSAENVSAVLDEAVRGIVKKVRGVSDKIAAAGRGDQDRCFATLMLAKIIETGPGEWAAVVKGIGDSKAVIRRADGRIEQVQIKDDGIMEIWKREGFPERNRVTGEMSYLPLSGDEAFLIEQSNGIDDFQNKLDAFNRAQGVSMIEADQKRLTKIFRQYKRDRNQVTRMLGMKGENPDAHSTIVNLRAGDRLYLLSDGITDNLTLEEMQQAADRTRDGNVSAEWVRSSQERMADGTDRSKKDDATVVELGLPQSAIQIAKENDQEQIDAIRMKLGIA